MTRLSLVLMVLAGLVNSASPDDGSSPAAAVGVGANRTTLEFVRSTIDYHTGNVGSASYRTLTDADLYRELLAGRLDMVSVFGRPDQLGVDGFAKGFRRPPAQLVVGHLACMVVVPASRKTDRLTLTQLADVVAGKTTTWDKLGAGAGSIEVRADPAALAVLQLRTGARPGKGLVLADRGDTGENIYLAVVNRAAKRSRPAAPNAAKPDILGLASAPSLLDGRRDWKRAKLAPVAAAERDRAVMPSLANIRGETYPLSTTWRILVHPDAPQQAAGFAKLCLRGYEGLTNSGYVLGWLVQPRQDELGNVVRVFGLGGKFGRWRADAIDSVLGAYRKSHPDVTIGSGRRRARYVEEFLEENVDLLHSAGRLSPYDRAKLLPLYDGKIPEQVIGYQPLLVLVHPSCPVRQMTLAQVRRIAEHDVTQWSQIGWAKEEALVVKRARARLILQDSLFDGETKHSRGDADVRAMVRLDHLTDASMLQEARNDPHGVTFALASDAALASGLKVLAITDSKHGAVLPTPADVVSGRYPARYPMTVLLHPKAGEPAGRLLEWLRGPAAGEILAAKHIYTPAFVAMGKPEKSPHPPAQSVAIRGKVSGGVAVLPTECLSLYFLMAGEEHRAAYDQAIAQALAADGRLRMVDRDQIERVLEERKNALRSGHDAQGRPIVAADVFVVPGIVTEGTRTLLRVRAYHGATASLLSEVQVPIDPALPTQFDPPLAKTIAAWWPGVLSRLVAARSLPVWSVLEIYAGQSEDPAAAERVAEQLGARLAGQPGLFVAGYVCVDAAQQEVLLSVMGVARPVAGRFTPAADVLVEGRLVKDAGLEVRLRSGKTMGVIARRRFTGTTAVQVEAAAAWCLAQAGSLKRETAGADLQDWAAEQARQNLRRYEQLKADYWAFHRKATARAGERGQKELLPPDASRLASLADSARQCATRAAQLDPTNEAAAYVLTTTRWNHDSSFSCYLQRAVACGRYCDRFPQSPRWRGLMESAVANWSQCYRYVADEGLRGSDEAKVPAGIDHEKAASIYLRESVHCLAQYMQRFAGCYDDPKEKRGSWWGFPSFVAFYQRELATYLAETDAAPAEVDREVDQWARLFDRRPDLGAPSEILRLQVLTLKKDRAGFLAALTDLQKAHPDPKEAYWARSKEQIRKQMQSLFPEVGGRDNHFLAWLEGRHGPGGLPFDGYDPNRFDH